MPSPNDDIKTNLQAVNEEIYKKNLELLQERRRAEQLLNGVSEAVFAVDKNHNITLFNNTVQIMVGIHADDALIRSVDDIIVLEDEGGKRILISEYCFSEDPEKQSLSAVILKGKYRDYYVNVKTTVITESVADDECLVTMVDITTEKELEKTKDDFISITSHELRTPMSIIKSYLWMLEAGKGGELNEKQAGYVERASKGTERMLDLINDMLNISRIEQGRIDIKVEKLEVKHTLEDAIGDFRIKMEEKGLEFVINIDPKLSFIYGDKKKVREILINLVGNSFKFTDEGKIEVNAILTDNDMAKISVIDTGKGLDEDDIKRLFRKFSRLDFSYQTVAESGGTGLGLYIVKLLVEAMGGKTGVDSEGRGHGSTFWFTLPTSLEN